MTDKVTYILCMGEEAAFDFAQPIRAFVGPDYLLFGDEVDLIFMVLTDIRNDSDLIFKKAIEALHQSESMDFMVYKMYNGNRKHLSDINLWSIEIEISEADYDILYINLCQKARKFLQTK